MFNFLSFLGICLLIGSCSHQYLKLNQNLIDDYRIKSSKNVKFSQPYISIFSDKKYKLHFIAAKHQNGESGSTCQTIRAIFKQQKFEFLLVEGVAFSIINNPKDVQYARECQNNHFENCGEDACAISEAINSNTPFNYAEPTDLEIKERMIAQGYNENEIAFFYALRFIPEIHRMNIKEVEAIKSRLMKYLKNVSTKRLQLKEEFTLDKFELMFLEKFQHSINYLTIDTNTTSPQIDQSPSWANITSSKIGRIRSEFILEMIEDRLNHYHSIVVVYGAGHLVELRKALEASLGPSYDLKLF